jgi:cytochrome P450
LSFASALVRHPGPALEDLHRRYGPVVRAGFGPMKTTFVFGRDANEYVLSTNTDAFRWREAMQPLAMVDGDTALVVSDGDDHKRRRRLVQPAFAMKRVDAHLGCVVAEIDRTLDGWTPGRRLDAHAELRAAVRRIVLRALFGERLAAQSDEIGDLLEPAMQHIQRPPFQRFDVDVPLTHYGRSMRKKRQVDALVHAEIDRRRAEGVDPERDNDILTALVANGGLSDVEMRDQVISLIAAGYDTTAAGAAWLVLELGRNPDVLERIRAEAGDGVPTVDALRAMPAVHGAVHEVLRLWPPGPVAGRYVQEAVDLGGYRIEPGHLLIYSAWVTHRLPELWPDPLRFDPDRWAPSAPEPQPFSFVPFGGGYRRCIGFALATLELQVLAVRLAQRVRYRLEARDPQPSGLATNVPRGGVPITTTS